MHKTNAQCLVLKIIWKTEIEKENQSWDNRQFLIHEIGLLSGSATLNFEIRVSMLLPQNSFAAYEAFGCNGKIMVLAFENELRQDLFPSTFVPTKKNIFT